MFNISTQIGDDLVNDIREICKSEKRSKSFIFREALYEFVSNYRVKRNDNTDKRQDFIAKLRNIDKVELDDEDSIKATENAYYKLATDSFSKEWLSAEDEQNFKYLEEKYVQKK